MAVIQTKVTAPTVAFRPAQARLAEFVVHGRIDEGARALAVPALIDTLAVTLAGGAEPGVQRLAAALGTDGRGVPSFWSPVRYREDDAALLLGMASHVLDYDDVCMLAICHPSAPILTALLAGADRDAASGREVLDAFLIGTEVLIRLGQAMGFRHYALGFHATATLGAIGATAALARLRGFDETRTRHALSLAASLAGGLRANFGSHVKSLHVGFAAANGLRAARLAAAGLEGAPEAFDGSGYLQAFSGGETTAWGADVALGEPFAIAEPGFEQKRYPCCYMLHRMIEGTLALRRETGLDLGTVASVDVEVGQGGTSALIHPYPKTGMNALFSGPYAVAAALRDGRVDLASFTDVAVLRPELQRRLHDVRITERTTPPRIGSDVGGAPVTVTLTPTKGPSVSRTVTASPGSPADPLTPEQLRAKWDDCLRRPAPDLDGATLGALFEEGLRASSDAPLGGWLSRLSAGVTR